MIINKEDIQTFIFVHDQNIILENERIMKFKDANHFYVFLGSGNIEKLIDFKNIIYARNLQHNLENYPKMCSYSGWYALYKNNIITSKYVNLFEYDVELCDDFTDRFILNAEDDVDYYGYFPHYLNDHFLFNQIKNGKISEYYPNLQSNIINKSQIKNITLWCATSNVTVTSRFFQKYMLDSEDFFLWVKNDNQAGHELERNLSVYHILSNENIKVKYLLGMMRHYQLNSHHTY